VARVLTAVRVTVRPANEAEWLATIRALATRLGFRGQHLWVFRSRTDPTHFLEFTEGKDETAHRRHGPIDDEERALETRLRQLAEYPAAGVHEDVWEEIPPAPPTGSS
jgi:hypothetical protein